MSLFVKCRLIDVEISFQIKGINLQTVRARELPDCYTFSGVVSLVSYSKCACVCMYSMSALVVSLSHLHIDTHVH